MSCDHARTCGDCFTAAYEAAQDQRIQELESQCGAMREALEAANRGYIEATRDLPGIESAFDFSLPDSPIRRIRAALATDAGKALLERLALLNQTAVALRQAQRDQRTLLDAHTETLAKLSQMSELAEKAERERDALIRQDVWVSTDCDRHARQTAESMRERAAKVAEAEPGLSDDPNPETLSLIRVDPVVAVRSAVAVTKRNIAAAIRALPLDETEGR